MHNPDAAIDVDALRQKYAEERDRRLRPDGIAQYVEVAGPFASFAEDPWANRVSLGRRCTTKSTSRSSAPGSAGC